MLFRKTSFKKALRQLDPLLHAICDDPFLRELSAGHLDPHCFQLYLSQDYYYLSSYSQALQTLSDASPYLEDKQFFQDCVRSCQQEPAFAFHKTYLADKVAMNSACANYLAFIQKHLGAYTLGVAAVFPCFYVYQQAAQRLSPGDRNNPYIHWFDTYTHESFCTQNKTIYEILERDYNKADELTQNTLMTIIEDGTRLEREFWQACYAPTFSEEKKSQL